MKNKINKLLTKLQNKVADIVIKRLQQGDTLAASVLAEALTNNQKFRYDIIESVAGDILDNDRIVSDLAQHIEPYSIANEIDLCDLANVINTDDIAYEVAHNFSASEIAESFSPHEIAQELDASEIADQIQERIPPPDLETLRAELDHLEESLTEFKTLTNEQFDIANEMTNKTLRNLSECLLEASQQY